MGDGIFQTGNIIGAFFLVFVFCFSPQSVSNAQGILGVSAMAMHTTPSPVIDVQHVSIFNSQRLLDDEEYFNDVINKLGKDLEKNAEDAEITLKRINDSIREFK